MNQQSDCVTPQASYQVQASKWQVSTEEQWFSFKASNENAQSWVQWVSHTSSSGPCSLERGKKCQVWQLSYLPACKRNTGKLGVKKTKLTGPSEEEEKGPYSEYVILQW